MSRKTLLLNSDWSPLCFVTERRAIKFITCDRADVVDVGNGASLWDDVYHFAEGFVHVPATIRLRKRIERKRFVPQFSKLVLFNRDAWTCQYCGVQLCGRAEATVDHVVPRCKGGVTSWTNCVTSCRPCNKKKGDRSLADAHMSLLEQPKVPPHTLAYDKTRSSAWHDDWDTFLCRN
jgi:hypothetical protein